MAISGFGCIIKLLTMIAGIWQGCRKFTGYNLPRIA